MSREMGSWVVPAERANSIFADPWNLIQVMLAKGEGVSQLDPPPVKWVE
jgi:hypothetical protein